MPNKEPSLTVEQTLRAQCRDLRIERDDLLGIANRQANEIAHLKSLLVLRDQKIEILEKQDEGF
jgi:hypothetical protein